MAKTKRYTIEWAELCIDHPNYIDIKRMCKTIHDLITPPCNCAAIKMYNKIKHSEQIGQIETMIDDLIYMRV